MNFKPQSSVRIEAVEMRFGKYKGKTLMEVMTDDPKYLDWLNGQDIGNAQFAAQLKEFCEKYSAEIERAIEIDE